MSKLILMLLFGLFSFFGFSQNKEQINPEVEIFLHKEMIAKAKITTDLVNSFACTQSGFLLISSSKQFYIVGVGGMGTFGELSKNPVNGFSLAENGRLMIISNTTLFEMDTTGYFKQVISLPNTKMGVFTNKTAVFLYEQYPNKKKDYAIYILLNNGNYVKLLQSPNPVNSLFADKNIVLFSVGNKIYQADIQTKDVKAVCKLPDEKETIISITKDLSNSAIYFSSEKAIYQILSNELKCINDQFSGKLFFDKEGLLVYNNTQKFIVRLRKNTLYAKESEPMLKIIQR
jgi:hypothetical protein